LLSPLVALQIEQLHFFPRLFRFGFFVVCPVFFANRSVSMAEQAQQVAFFELKPDYAKRFLQTIGNVELFLVGVTMVPLEMMKISLMTLKLTAGTFSAH